MRFAGCDWLCYALALIVQPFEPSYGIRSGVYKFMPNLQQIELCRHALSLAESHSLRQS
jgi:hypothetical protein